MNAGWYLLSGGFLSQVQVQVEHEIIVRKNAFQTSALNLKPDYH